MPARLQHPEHAQRRGIAGAGCSLIACIFFVMRLAAAPHKNKWQGMIVKVSGAEKNGCA